ncbi:MAG: lactate utilization protein [Saccharofermentans sp.]|nr:lactate utilization protein [Saccharofermentans sp.]
MDDNKKVFYRNQAEDLIKKLELHKMKGYYCDTSAHAKEKILELIGEGKKTVAYGGSMTIDDMGVKDLIVKRGHDLIVRENAHTKEEIKELNARVINSDTFLMSTNAITLSGELINVDGRGNRVCYLIYGPEQVIVVCGMNKVVTDIDEGINRVKNFASPPNTVRLKRETPCAKLGRCGNCVDDTICCQTVITRVSMIPGRIKVILVGEELGY